MRRSRLSRVVLVGTLLLVVASMILGLFSSSRAKATYYAGGVDSTFAASTTQAYSLGVLSNGTVLVGYWSSVNQFTSAGVSTGVSSTYGGGAQSIQVTTGDKFYVGGGYPSGYLIRFNSNGSKDTAFTTPASASTIRYQDAIRVDSGGNVITVNASSPYLYKFNSSGVKDATFETNVKAAMLGSEGYAIELQSDGKILVGTNGALKRYNTNGTLDATLASGIGAVKSIVQLSDGSIVVASASSPYLRKFSSSGTLDSTFTTNVGSTFNSNAQVVRVDSSGRLVVGGNFSGYVKRLSATGIPDTSFNTNAALSINNNVNSLAIQSDGNILVAFSGGVKRLLGSNVAPNTPSAPTGVAGDGQVTVTVTQPSGAVPTQFRITAVELPDRFCTVTGSSGSCVITGLANGSPYTFTATATNSDATSAASAASSPITPVGVPPVFQSAAVNAFGTILTMTYNEALGSTTAAATDFTVIAGGVPVTVTSVTVSGSTVQLALGEVVIQGQSVTVSYAAPASSSTTSNAAIQDALGTDAASLSTRSVTNDSLVDRTPPVYASVANTAAGTTITLTYNENLSTTTALASAFTVTNGGAPISVSSVATTSGTKTVVLTLASPVGQGKTVTVSYDAPAVDATTANSAIQDVAGNDAPSLAALTLATNSSTVDQTGPVFSSATLANNGLTLTLNYNETLRDPRAPASAFTVLVNGSPVTVSSVAASGNTSSVVLTLSTVVGSGKTVTVAYEAPTTDNATSNAAIQDLVGNDAASLSARAITNNSTVDQIAPVFSSASVSSNGLTLTLNYNETLRDPRAAASAFTVLVNGSPVTVSSVAASGNTSSVVLTLASPIGSGKAVTIAYDAPAVDAGTTNAAIQDTTGNDAVSLSATTVTNSSTVDQTAPVFSSATLAANGLTLTLNYNEVLRDPRAPASAFTVLANGSPVNVSSVSANGAISTVVLTLATAIANDKVITITYDAPTVDSSNTNAAIQDTAGNDAVSLSARAVTNSSAIDIARPTFASATVLASGTQMDITFSEIISCTISADSAFTVFVNGSPVMISGFNRSCPSNKITANLSGITVTSNQTVTVSYSAPTDDSSNGNAALQDPTGNDMLSASNFAVTNSSAVAPDLRAPIFTSATTNTMGTLVTLTYDETLISTTAPASAYTVTINGVDFQPSAAVVSGNTVQLTMGTAIEFGKTVTVSYNAPTVDSLASNSAVQDSSGNDSLSLSNVAVSNFSSAGPDVTPPTLSTVSASGTTVTLTFNETLGSVTADKSRYTVFVGNDPVTISGASVSGSTVVLTLASAIPSGELVSVSYTAPTSSTATSNAAIQDYAGNDAASFSGNNRTTSTAWSWLGTPAHNSSCAGSLYAETARQRSLPNGVTYSVAVSGPYICMFEESESLSQRGGTTSNFTKTGLITDPGAYFRTLEPFTTTGDTECVLYTMGATLSKCLNRGFVTMTFSEPTLNPVISFAGWGGNDGGARSWSELELVTPGVTLTMLSGTNIQVINGTYVGVVNPSPGTRCNNSIPAGCGSLQVNGTVTEVKFALNYNASGSGWGNDDEWNMVASVVEDFGQLPSRYDLPAASHVVGHLKLGSVVTADNLNVLYGTTNADAVTNGTAIPANEDGVSALAALGDGDVGTTYSLPVSLSGVERTARLCGWIDFNRDGTMSLAERTCATNPAAGDTSATLSWTVPSDIVAGLTYARIRLSYDAVPIPTGKVASGEVEDYSFVIASNAIPNAVNDTSTNAQDINQIISPLANDNFEAGYPADNASLFLCGYGTGPFACDKTSLFVPGQGTYTVNSNGTVTFDPLPNYVGTATGVRYQIADTQGRARTATITPTVTPSPTATADTTRDYVNITQSKDVLTNDAPGVGVFSMPTVKLCSSGQTPSGCSATTVSVTGGVYTLNTSTGVITFTPETDWAGTAPPVTYQVADGSGQVASSTYTPTVVSQPTAANDASSDDYDVTQTISPLLNDNPGGSPLVPATLKLCGIDDPATSGVNESESPNNCTKTSLTIPGEGTYTVNSNGTVTFNPLPTFYGTASSRPYQISDALGETASATITPSVGTPPLPRAQPNTSSDDYDTDQTLSPLDGDTAGSSSFPLQVSSIKLCGLADNTVTPAIAAETPNSCSQTTVTVPGEGTYTLNTTTGVVTFDPLPTFTGQVQTPVTYQVKDSLDRYVNSTLTPTVGPPPVPTATADALTRGYDANQLYTPIGNDTAGAADFPLLAASVKLCGIDPVQTPNSCDKTTVTVPGEGTYTVNSDGTVTFDPLPSFTGQVQTPVRYQAKDSLDRFVNSTITPTVGPPPVPTASPDALTRDYDTNQTYTPIGNDTAGAADFPLLAASVKLCGIDPVQTPNSCDKTTVTVPGEGTYTVNSDGTVTFDPLPSFTGQVQTPVRYQAKDSLDRFVNSTITPTVGPPPVPTASPDALTRGYDTNQTYTPIGNDTAGAADFPLLAASVKLCGLADAGATPPVAVETPNTCSQTSLTIPGEGTYTVNSDGTVSFDPLPTFTGPVQTPVRYQANDSLDRYVDTTITPTVGPPPAPTASPDALTRDYDTNQTYTPIGNDTAGAADFPLLATSVKLCGLADAGATPPVAAETPNTCSQTSLTIPGEGTYTVNSDGTVTFNPLPTFTGQVQTPVRYQANDSLDRYVNTTITPTVGPPPVPSASPDAITTDYDTNQTYTPLGNDTAGAADFPLLASSVKLCGLDDPATVLIDEAESPNACSKTTLTVPGEGTYTVNSDGTVTFNPLPTFTGQVQTPVRYQANDSLDRYVNTTITPTIGLPPIPTASPDAIRDSYDKNQPYSPLANDTPGVADFPLLASSVKLCGLADASATPPVAAETPNNCTKSSVTVPGEGTYTVNPDGTVTFNPLPTFTGIVATPVKYQANDSLNRFVSATITPRVDPPTAPIATPETQSVLPGATATYTTVIGASGLGTGTGLQAGSTNGPCLVDPATTLCGTSVNISGEGTWTINQTTGVATFAASPSIASGTRTSVTYRITDIAGQTATSTLTPVVPPAPDLENDTSTGPYDTNQVIDILDNDDPGHSSAPLVASTVKLCGLDDSATSGTNEAETAPNCTKSSVTVPGEGTYTVNLDGTVTFNPLPTFTGTVATPVTYQVADTLGQIDSATITPRVDPPTAPIATPETQSVLPGATATYTTVIGASGLGTGTGLQSGSTNGPCLVDPATTLCGTSVNIPGEGTWTIDQITGVATFAASPSIASGTRTSVTYRITDIAGQTATSTLTPVVPPAPELENDTSTGPYDTNQVIDILDNDDPGHVSAPLVASSVKLCGIDPLQTPNSCDKTSVTVPGEGTYTVNPDGTVTFNPLDTFAGTVTRPVTYQVADTLGQIDSATITPTVTPPPINVVNDTSSGLYDTNQVVPVLTNDTPGAQWVASSVKLCGLDPLQTPNSCDKTSVTVPGEGTYTVNPDGTVTFNPLPSFTGQAQTSVTYQVTDILGRTEDATITPTVGPPPLPTASPDALTRNYDTDQTYTPLGNDTRGATDFPFVASSLKLCGLDPVQTPNNCTQTSLTVPGEGTYTVNGDGTVTFNPLPTFVGQVATPVTYQAQDSLSRFVNTTITPTVLPPPLPTASPDAITTDYDTNQTYTPLGNDTPGAADFPLLASSVKLCGLDPVQTPNNCTQTSLTVPGEGTYTVNGDGTVTFNPLPTFVGQVATPVKYQAKDSLDRLVNTTITPTILPPPIPTAEPDAITDDYDKNQTYTPLGNDTAGAPDFPLLASSVKLCGIDPVQTPNSCDKTSVTVPGEGTYTVNPDGTVTFNPLDSFAGTVTTPVTYQAKDSLNRFVDETITPTVTPPPINVVNDTSSGLYDTNQVIPVLTNDTPGAQWVPSTVKLCRLADATATPAVTAETAPNCTQTSVTVPGEGTYTVNPDGTVTFNPLPSFTGQAQTPVTYQVTDILGRTEDATITPTVGPPPSPTASPDALTRAYDTDQTYTPLGNDTRGAADFPFAASSLKLCGIDPAQTPNSCDKTSLTVPGEGTYTVNPDGSVTFDPLPTFVGQVATPVKYQAKDSLDRFVNTTITPTVLPPPVPSASPDAITTDYDTNQTYTPLGNDTAGAADFPLLASSVKLCGINPAQTPNSCDKTSLTVPGEGTYTVNPDGTVTFNPLPTFVGQVATPVKYQAKDSLNRFVNTTITPTILPPPVPTAQPDALTTDYDTNQTYTPLANDPRGATDFPLLASSVKLCGIDPVQTPNSCDKTSVTVPGEGTYTVNPDGTVTFNPLPTFVGQVATPVTYQAKDSLNRFVDETITPTILPPPLPTAQPDAMTTNYDTNQTYTPLANDPAGATSFPLLASSVKLCGIDDTATVGVDEAEIPNNCTQTSLTVPGEGTYTVNPDGTVTFNPLPTFVGEVATPVTYQAKDSLNRFVDETITPTILPPPLPRALPDAITTDYDTNQTYTPLANDPAGATDFPLVVSSLKLCGIDPVQTPNNCTQTSLTVPGEGTYTVNPDGTVTFNPLPTFVGQVATSVKYQAKDSLDRFVNTTITPTILPPPLPTAEPDAITTDYDTNQTYTPLDNDRAGAADFPLLASSVKLCGVSPVQTPNNCTQTSLAVPGEGTYTVNPDGTVSFDPLPTFVGQVATPVTYQAKDSLNRFVDETITPTILPPPAPTATPDAITDDYDKNQTYTPLANDTRGATDFPLLASSVKLCGIDPVQTPNNCTQTSLTVPGEGTYTVNPDGTVTFDPLPTFTGTVATPVKYQAKDSLNRFVNTTITPTVTAPAITVVDDTKTGPYDTNQTIAVLTNDIPSAQWAPSSVKLCGLADTAASPPVTAETPNSCTKSSVTVPGEGTYTVNPDGTVTFDPLPTFVGPVATPVTYQVTDVLGRTADADIRPTVLPPPPPIATPETRVVVPSGTAVFTNVIGTSALASGVQLQTGATNGPCLVDPATTLCGTTVVIDGEGTWTIDRTTGVATFVAEAGIATGPRTPVTYRVTDFAGQTATSTLRPIVPPPPSATDDFSSGPFDTNQSLTPFSNDSFDSLAPVRATSLKLCGAIETPNSCSQSSVVVPNEGTYTINSDGTVTFDPLPTFFGPAAPLPYQAEDIYGRFVDATLNPSVSRPNAPVALPETKVVLPGSTISFTNVIGASALASGAQLQSGATNGPCLVDPATSLCGTTVVIDGEGTWTIDQTTGVATFVADPEITVGTKTPVTYRVTDAVGQTASSTLTPIVPPPPTATNDAQTGPLDINQTYRPLNNDSFSSLAAASPSTLRLCGAGQTPNNCDKTTVVVANEGTYTAYSDGRVIFDPLSTFIGTATPITYQVADIYGRTVNATITPTILPPPIPAATLDTGKAKEGKTVVLTPWLNDSAGVVVAGQTGKASLVPTTVRLCPINMVAAKDVLATGQPDPACTLMKIKTADGTYTVDPKTGKVTFVHRKGFIGEVTQPVPYQIATDWKIPSGVLTARSMLIPTIMPLRTPMVTIGDKVWRDVNGDGYQSKADRGIPGVKVTLRTASGEVVVDINGSEVGPQFTDKKGKYQFTDLPSGRYKVIVEYPNGFKPTIANRKGREKNSSTRSALSRELVLGQSDNSLDFGMVGRRKPGLAHTT